MFVMKIKKKQSLFPPWQIVSFGYVTDILIVSIAQRFWSLEVGSILRWTIHKVFLLRHKPKLARTGEYANCIFAEEGKPPPPQESVLDMTLNNLMVRIQF